MSTCPVCFDNLDEISSRCNLCKGNLCLNCFQKLDKCPLCRNHYEIKLQQPPKFRILLSSIRFRFL